MPRFVTLTIADNGSITITGDPSMAVIDRRGAVVSSVDPIIGADPSASLAIKSPCRVASTAPINLQTFGLGSIDGVQLVAGDRVLLKDQSAATQNGIYVASTGVWQRALDADGNDDWTKGTQVTVTDGTALGRTMWMLTSANPVIVGTSAMTFTLMTSSPTASG